jgi:hypothetical protein
VPDFEPGRNAKYASNTLLYEPSSRQLYPLDSTKTRKECVHVRSRGSTRSRHARDREAGLATKYFRPCFSLCFLELILRHQHSDLVLNGNRRGKIEFASEPKRVHFGLLRQSGGSPPALLALTTALIVPSGKRLRIDIFVAVYDFADYLLYGVDQHYLRTKSMKPS